MVRKAPATTKHKGSQHNETFMPGITEAADFIQRAGDNEGKELDDSIEKAAHKKSAGDIMDVPVGGLNSDIMAPANTE